MTDAGRIMVIPKGKYNASITYEKLDAVTYNGKGFIALKTVSGVTPTDDGTNWRLYVDNADINVSDLAPTFTVASARENINSGEKMSTLFSKVKKYFTDIKGHAYKDLVTNATTTTAGSPLDATVAKTLNDSIGTISSKVTQNTNDISELKTTDNVLSSRIDTFTSLTQGSTTGDAELQDIRVKADGTTATSAGNAVREQISELKEENSELKGDLADYSNISYNSANVINLYDNELEQGYIDGANGADSSAYPKAVRSKNYYRCNGYTKIQVYASRMNDFDVYLYFYTEDRSFISSRKIERYTSYSVPNNAYYCRIGTYGNVDVNPTNAGVFLVNAYFTIGSVGDKLNKTNSILSWNKNTTDRISNRINIFDNNLSQGYIDGSNNTIGGTSLTSSVYSTNYLNCYGYSFIQIERTRTDFLTYIYFYDENKNIINYRIIDDYNSLPVPRNAHYIRFCAYNSTEPITPENAGKFYVYCYVGIIDIKERYIDYKYSANGLPILSLSGNMDGISKDNKVTLNYNYGNIGGTCTLKWQGNTSLQFPKKNYTITFDSPFEAKEGWGEQKKYCLKANWVDFSHSRNIVSARLWAKVVASRSNIVSGLENAPNYGAIDGFPISLVINNVYQGLYTMNIPKDAWMFGMGDGSNECLISAEGNSVICNFNSATALCDDTDFSFEYISDDELKTNVVSDINNMIQMVIDSNESNFDLTVGQVLDIQSVIDYYIFTCLITGGDNLYKNYILGSYGGKWFFNAYDMDGTFGNYPQGNKYAKASSEPDFESWAKISTLMRRIAVIKADDVKTRYAELRNSVLSEESISYEFENFTVGIPKSAKDKEVEIWGKIPGTTSNNVAQILNNYRLRCQYLDKKINMLQSSNEKTS